MIPSGAIKYTLDKIDWPVEEAIAAERIIEGTPSASTVILENDGRAQIGFWRVTPGVFTTCHEDYLEFIHIIDGEGALLSDTGDVTELNAGTTVLMPYGWTGQWIVRKAIVKCYTTISF